MRIKAILFDVIGTTVIENDPTIISGSFNKAFNDFGLNVDEDVIQFNRGKDKREIIKLLLMQQKIEPAKASDIYNSFIKYVEARLNEFQPREQAVEIFDYLKSMNIKIGLGTGLSRDLFEKILKHINWPLSRFDYIGIAENGIRPRPHPDMLQDLMMKLNLLPSEVLKVGDTVADVEEGKNAGVKTVAILAGTQRRETLEAANPDFIIQSLVEIRTLID